MADDWGAAAVAQEQRDVKGLSDKVEDLKVSGGGSAPEAKAEAPAPATAAPSEDKEHLSAAEKSYLNKLIQGKLVHNTQPLDVQHADPNSPLYSVKSFEELNLTPALLKGVYNMGFTKPSRIQETALPILMADPPQNMIAQSQSGTGKTAAFCLAVLSRIDPAKKYPQALVLSPTFELARQIGDSCRQMAKFCEDIDIILAVRGERCANRVEEQIVIGTPGTVLDWMLRKRAFDPKKLVAFVLDEADVMISLQGHQDQSIRVHRQLRPECQTMFFSATYDQPIIDFAHKVVRKAVTLTLKREQESLENIRQIYIMCPGEQQKYEALSNIYGTISIGQSMVFCHTRKSAAWLAQKMTEDGHAVAILTGDLSIEQRVAILDRFRRGKEKLLITTNVSARGLDIEQVTVVVNYDLPIDHITRKPDFETYLHRIGRTGRFGKSGLAINLIDGHRSFQQLMEIEKHFGREIEKIQANDIDDLERLAE